MWCSAWRCGYVAALGHPFLRIRCILIISFIDVGSLCPVLSSLTVSCFNRSKTLSYPLPLLLLKPYSSSCNNTSFIGFPHSPIVTSIHLPHIIPSNPRLHNTHNLRPPGLYSTEFIFNMPFSHMSILIDNCKDNKNLPLGLLKNSLSTSQQDLAVSTKN